MKQSGPQENDLSGPRLGATWLPTPWLGRARVWGCGLSSRSARSCGRRTAGGRTPRAASRTLRGTPRGNLSALDVFHSKSSLCGVSVWARRALNSPSRRFSARAVPGEGQERRDARCRLPGRKPAGSQRGRATLPHHPARHHSKCHTLCPTRRLGACRAAWPCNDMATSPLATLSWPHPVHM
jgi:hypothetical protein